MIYITLIIVIQNGWTWWPKYSSTKKMECLQLW